MGTAQAASAETAADSREALVARIAALEAALASSRAEAARRARRGRIESLLAAAGAIDVEAASAVAEAAAGAAEGDDGASAGGPDLDAIVSRLVSDKPFLFRGTAAGGGGSATAPRVSEGSADLDDDLTHAAADACATGRRRDLLRYLRLKRRAASV